MASDKRASRRRYSEEIKARVMAECEAAGASVAKVAMSHGINANIVHRWRQLAREARPVPPRRTGEFEFVPVSLAAPPAATATHDIQIHLRRGTTTMTITWPVSAAGDFAIWMRELLR